MSHSSSAPPPVQAVGPWFEKPISQFDRLNEEMKFVSRRNFVLAAATVTLRGPKLLVVHNTDPKYDESFYALPGGPSFVDESLEDAAIRNTMEDTGYTVRLQYLSKPTRAPPSRLSGELLRKWKLMFPDDSPTPSAEFLHPDLEVFWRNSFTTEDLADPKKVPIGMISFREPLEKSDRLTLRFCFYAVLENGNRLPIPPPDPGEHLMAKWVTVPDALDMLRFDAEKEAVKAAYALHLGSHCSIRGLDQLTRGCVDISGHIERVIEFVLAECPVSDDHAVKTLQKYGWDITKTIYALTLEQAHQTLDEQLASFFELG